VARPLLSTLPRFTRCPALLLLCGHVASSAMCLSTRLQVSIYKAFHAHKPQRTAVRGFFAMPTLEQDDILLYGGHGSGEARPDLLKADAWYVAADYKAGATTNKVALSIKTGLAVCVFAALERVAFEQLPCAGVQDDYTNINLTVTCANGKPVAEPTSEASRACAQLGCWSSTLMWL
jgi:hypothetical protein